MTKPKRLTKEDEARIDFFFKIENSKVKPLNLKESNFKIVEDLYNRILAKKINSVPDIKNLLLKSYYENGNMTVLNNLADQYGQKSTLPGEIIPIFLNDYFGKNYDLDFSIEERNNALNEIIVKNLEDAFGNFINITDVRNSNLKSVNITDFSKKLAEDGYQICEDFAVSKNNVEKEPNKEHQDLLLYKYNDVVKEYIQNKKTGSQRSVERFDKLNDFVEAYLNNCENLMTEETKSKAEFLNAKKVVDRYFTELKFKIKDNRFREISQSEYYTKIMNILKKKDQLTLDEQKELKNFVKDAENICKALTYKDKKGKQHPVNFYLEEVSKNTTPLYMTTLLIEAIKTDFFSDDEKKKLHRAKIEIRDFLSRNVEDTYNMAIPQRTAKESFRTEKDLENLLSKYRYKRDEIDLTKQENYEKFIKKVWNYIEDNNLPKFKTCAQCLAVEFINGREPIDRGFMVKNPIKEK